MPAVSVVHVYSHVHNSIFIIHASLMCSQSAMLLIPDMNIAFYVAVWLMQEVEPGRCKRPASCPADDTASVPQGSASSCFGARHSYGVLEECLRLEPTDSRTTMSMVVIKCGDTCDPTNVLSYHIMGDSFVDVTRTGNLFAASHGACIASDHTATFAWHSRLFSSVHTG
jgi:hypothetical protein